MSEPFVKLMAVTGPLIANRRPFYVRLSDVRALVEQDPEGSLGIVNTVLFVTGFGQPVMVSGGADINYARLMGDPMDGEADRG